MQEQIKKLVENQMKIVSKIQEQGKEITKLQNRIGGLETILIESGITKEAIELHQSFDDKKMREAITNDETKMI